MNLRLYPTTLLLAMLIGVIACEEGETPIQGGFDRGDLLENMAQNLIIPAYTDLQTHVSALKSSAEGFVENPDLTSLGICKRPGKPPILPGSTLMPSILDQQGRRALAGPYWKRWLPFQSLWKKSKPPSRVLQILTILTGMHAAFWQ